MRRLHLSSDGQRTECGRDFRRTGGLRSTPHPSNLTVYRDPPCRPCFERRVRNGDTLAGRCLSHMRVLGRRFQEQFHGSHRLEEVCPGITEETRS